MALVSSTADVAPAVSGRGADQALIGVVGGELRHVEADVRVLVPEQQARERLRELGLADAGRAGEEGYAARPAPSARRADTGDGPLHDVEHVGDGLVLPLHALADEVRAAPHPGPVDRGPGIVADPDLVATDGVADLGHGDALAAGQLLDGDHVEEEHPLRPFHERVDGLRRRVRRRPGRLREPLHEGRRDHAARAVVGARDGHVADPGIADEQPVGQVALLVGDPEHGVEERLCRRPAGPGADGVGRHERAGEGLVLGAGERVVPHDEARREVDDRRDGVAGARREAAQRLGHQVEARRGDAVLVGLQTDLGEELAAGRRPARPRQLAEARHGVVRQYVGVSGLAQFRGQGDR